MIGARTRWLSAAACVALLSCRSGVPPSSLPPQTPVEVSRGRPRAAPTEVPTEVPAKPPERPRTWVLPRIQVAAAPWYEPPSTDVLTPHEFKASLADVAVGRHLAIVDSKGGRLAVHRHAGVVGVLPVDRDIRWVGVDPDDRLYVADAKGQLSVAPGLKLAQRQAVLEPRAAVEGAVFWDVSSKSIVAATIDAVHVSRDGGRSFAPAPALPPTTEVNAVFTRPDGAIVVDGDALTFVLTPGAKSWWTAPPDLEPLRRIGARIEERDSDCPRVLDRAGRTFVTAPPNWDLDSWSRLAALTDVPLRIVTNLVDFSHPAAPAKVRECPAHAEEGGGHADGLDEEPIRGSLGPRPPLTKRWFSLFADARCRTEFDDVYLANYHGEPCALGDAMSRPPRVAMWDDGELKVVALPPTCTQPRTIDAAGGIGVLRCGKSSVHSVFTIGADGQWHAEGAVHGPANDMPALGMADDGTLLFHGFYDMARGTYHSPYVRAPDELGGRWSPVTSIDAIASRVLDGARVLAISGDFARGYGIRLVDQRSSVHEAIVLGVHHGNMLLYDVVLQPDRSLELVFRSRDHASTTTLVLDENRVPIVRQPP